MVQSLEVAAAIFRYDRTRVQTAGCNGVEMSTTLCPSHLVRLVLLAAAGLLGPLAARQGDTGTEEDVAV